MNLRKANLRFFTKSFTVMQNSFSICNKIFQKRKKKLMENDFYWSLFNKKKICLTRVNDIINSSVV